MMVFASTPLWVRNAATAMSSVSMGTRSPCASPLKEGPGATGLMGWAMEMLAVRAVNRSPETNSARPPSAIRCPRRRGRRRRFGGRPARSTRRGKEPVLQVGTVHEQQFAQVARLPAAADLPHQRVVPVRVRHGRDRAGGVDGGRQLARFAQAGGDRLLDHHVEPGLDHGTRVADVGGIGRADVHDVRPCLQQLGQTRITGRDAPPLRGFQGPVNNAGHGYRAAVEEGEEESAMASPPWANCGSGRTWATARHGSSASVSFRGRPIRRQRDTWSSMNTYSAARRASKPEVTLRPTDALRHGGGRPGHRTHFIPCARDPLERIPCRGAGGLRCQGLRD
ncbi:hypothetical protein SAMN04490356_7628 [Streptomyces melanosporofaciens]|uniref:Uncharacterized protein n=1 Tax=Streptomyces melanosporofaciens TaxID=67327 RepID=A0A1H4Z666_STRMJ|nr:hypothetical protein SAMN04490356_7628 [Streptomyces melanosporofaciens]